MYSQKGLSKRYSRRYRYGGRRYRKPYSKEITTFGALSHLAKKAVSGVQYLKGLINVEFKTIDNIYSTTYSNSWSLNLINGISKGDDYNNRDGRQIRVKSIQLSFNPVMNSSSTVNQMVRIICFIWKAPDGTAPTIDDVLEAGATAMVRIRSLSDRKNTVILYDKVINLSAGDKSNVVERYYKRMDMKVVFNDGNTGSISDIDSNALYVAIVSNDNTNQPTVNWTSRVRFIDN